MVCCLHRDAYNTTSRLGDSVARHKRGLGGRATKVDHGNIGWAHPDQPEHLRPAFSETQDGNMA